mgnify:CR=1 FL=1
MVECESETWLHNSTGIRVLIDTWWNVNEKEDAYIYSIDRVLIDTWWNVNLTSTGYVRRDVRVLIDTWWNVNISLQDHHAILKEF